MGSNHWDPQREKQMDSKAQHRGRIEVGADGLVPTSRPAGEWEAVLSSVVTGCVSSTVGPPNPCGIRDVDKDGVRTAVKLSQLRRRDSCEEELVGDWEWLRCQA